MWIYQPESLTLYNQGAGYEVDLEDFTTPARVLDWILQIAGKQGDQWDLPGFVNALEKAVLHRFGETSQGVFCPFGESMKVDWRKRSFEKVGVAP